MVKVQIVGKPALTTTGTGQSMVAWVTGIIRFLSRDDRVLLERPFRERLDNLALMTTKQFTRYAINEMKAKLKEELREEQWADVQEMLDPLVVEEEEP
jgi:hypothetical protein